jgi:hypothetical protein
MGIPIGAAPAITPNILTNTTVTVDFTDPNVHMYNLSTRVANFSNITILYNNSSIVTNTLVTYNNSTITLNNSINTICW